MLSDTFKYISQFRHAGHQVGRKVGDMLELVTYSALNHDPELNRRMNVEPKLFGFSDAGHKVEFVLCEVPPEKRNGGEIKNIESIIGFVECKKVGVEQTVNQSFKKKFSKNPNGQGFIVPFDTPVPISFTKTERGKVGVYITIDQNEVVITDSDSGDLVFKESLQPYHRIIAAVFEDGEFAVLSNEQSLREFDKTLRSCRILDIYEIREEFLVGVVNECLSGPQTPEKAKQSSFVALDVRKRRFGTFDLRPDERDLVSILVITEFAHWEQKSRNMIQACIDYNLVVPDALIVEAFAEFEREFGVDFYAFISKETYENNMNVKTIIDGLVAKKAGRIFIDIADGNQKSITYDSGRLVIS